MFSNLDPQPLPLDAAYHRAVAVLLDLALDLPHPPCAECAAPLRFDPDTRALCCRECGLVQILSLEAALAFVAGAEADLFAPPALLVSHAPQRGVGRRTDVLNGLTADLAGQFVAGVVGAWNALLITLYFCWCRRSLHPVRAILRR